MSRDFRRLPHDTTKLFCEIWDNAEAFRDDYANSGLYVSELSDSLFTIFYLLYARYGNSSIANLDEMQFKYKVFSVMFQYGPTWRKRLSVQASLRALSESDIKIGAEVINDHSYAMGDNEILPGTDPTKIDQKSGTYYRKSKLEGYSQLLDLLETDVTGEFIDRFKSLFATFVYTRPDVFITDIIEDEESEDE